MQGYRELNNAWHWAFIVYYITIYMMSDIHTSTVWIRHVCFHFGVEKYFARRTGIKSA